MLLDLAHIAATEFDGIVISTEPLFRRAALAEKLRLYLSDGSFVDLWVNPASTRYSFHSRHLSSSDEGVFLAQVER